MAVTRFRRSHDVVFEMSGERALLLDSSGNEMITLNPVGSLIWNALKDAADADTIAARLRDLFPDVAADELMADVNQFLGELLAAGLVVVDDAPS